MNKDINKNDKKPQKGRRTLGRLASLARMGEVVFHTRDMANLWGMKNDNALYVLLSRYVRQGLLFRVQKGMYSIKPLEELDPFLLGLKALHTYAYVSTETILSKNGVLSQNIPEITLVSGASKRFSISGRDYSSRKLSDKFLYNPLGIARDETGVRRASVERAVADLLYFNPSAHMDASQSKIVDWERVQEIQKRVGYPVLASRLKLK